MDEYCDRCEFLIEKGFFGKLVFKHKNGKKYCLACRDTMLENTMLEIMDEKRQQKTKSTREKPIK